MYAFFEDRQAPVGQPAAWLFEDYVGCLSVRDLASWQSMLSMLADGSCWTVVALDYELGYLLEPKSAPDGWMPSERPLARCWQFRTRRLLSHEAAERWLASAEMESPAGVGNVRPLLAESAYCAAIDQIQRLISAGDCYQVNYTFPLQFEWFGSVLGLYRRLRERQPGRYGGLLALASGGVVSLSPELFLERNGDRLVTRPMKGTAPRAFPREHLLTSEKDRAENLMIVDLLRNDLGRVAANGSVVVDRLFDVEPYPTVWQMVSEVSANVAGRDLGEILAALFPCGSITGAPKIRAMQIVGELERVPRGLYTGSFGWLAPDGDFRLNVAIRTLELAEDGTGVLGIGSGVVADSRSDLEWAECLLKARFLTDADPGVLLIETLRRESGEYPHWERHWARLRYSAAWLGFPLDEPGLIARLQAMPDEGLWRVRLTLDKLGRAVVEAFPLSPEPAGPRWAILADSAIDSRNPLRRHKTTDRAIYDAALQQIVGDPAVFDMVFMNERGELAEGARSTLFVERDGVLLTPPLGCGALPGVLRAELLATGRAREAVLWPADLADGFWLGNALRGLVPVRLRGT